MRYTDRDCYAAMIRAAHTLNKLGDNLGVALPDGRSWTKPLAELADRLGVPIRRWGDDSCQDGPRLVLDHAPSCYGGGVRPMICEAGKTGQRTPRWWAPSAGLGPGAVTKREFCNILYATENTLSHGLAGLFDSGA